MNFGSPMDLMIISSARIDDTPPADVSVSGTSEFRGIIYAPLTDVSISGGSVFKGAVLGKNVSNPGGGPVHRDEDVRDMLLSYGSFSAVAWREVPYWIEEP